MEGSMKPRCAGCKRRITKGEPDLILRRMAEENPTVTALKLVYHERCKDAALERATERPALWLMTHRYIEAEAN
jgi:hypothetical protein